MPGYMVNRMMSAKAVHSKRSLMVSDSIRFRWRSSTPLQSGPYAGKLPSPQLVALDDKYKNAQHYIINPQVSI
jgi:hypothetical protein